MENIDNENIILVESEDVKYIKFKCLEKYNNVECIFTLKPLDFRVINDDKTKAIEEYNKICNSLNIDFKNVIVPKQTHTNIVKVLADEERFYDENLCEVDGIITDKKNKILSLTFADCTPIALFDPVNNVIANVHSGWKGTLNSIVTNAILCMKNEFSSNVSDIICIIGPTIRKCHFEVDEDVKDMFYEKYSYLDNINDIITDGRIVDDIKKYNIDTALLNKTIMKNLGIRDENIFDCGICSVCNSNLCHSYRTDKDKSGRATLIMYLK